MSCLTSLSLNSLIYEIEIYYTVEVHIKYYQNYKCLVLWYQAHDKHPINGDSYYYYIAFYHITSYHISYHVIYLYHVPGVVRW